MKPPAFIIAAALLFLFALAPHHPSHAATAADTWTKVSTKNFLLVGNADERDIRLVAVRLEQFREVFKRLLAAPDSFDSIIPTTVVVFRDDLAYRPFEPLYQGQPSAVAGYFQSSADVNYITLSADTQRARSPYALAFHEYVHLLVRNNFQRAPLWFNEGLAEFYSTFEISDGNRKVKLGLPIKNRIQTLRRRELLPLRTLLSIDDQSPYYNEQAKRDIFYAESWALVHYLLNGRSPSRRPQLLRYLEMLASGKSGDDAFRQAFQTDPDGLEKELRQYVEQNRYTEQSISFESPLEFNTEMTSASLSEAEARFYLGDLLLHTNRIEAAEAYLLESLKLDENLAASHTSLGMLRLRQNRYGEAIKYLERAVTLDPQSYLAHYTYADALSREGMASDNALEGYYSPEVLSRLRVELTKAIELAPRFIESYRLLALVNLVMNEQLDEAAGLLKKAIAFAPQRRELSFLLAQIHLRQDDFQAARSLLTTLLEATDNPRLRSQAQALLDTVTTREDLMLRLKTTAAQAELDARPAGEIQPCDAPQPGPQKKPLRFDGEQICGMLVRVECDEGSVMLVIEVGDRTLKLRNDALNRIRFVTYTSDVRGQMTCGLREPATPVLVTYRSGKEQEQQQRAHVDGEVLAVEFIPKDWNPTRAPAAP